MKSLPAIVVAALGLTACAQQASISLSYTPESIYEIDAKIVVNEFTFDSVSGADQDELFKTSFGTIVLSEPISKFVSDAIRREFRQSGISLRPPAGCRLDGRITEFSINNLGLSSSFKQNLSYVLTSEIDGAILFEKDVSTEETYRNSSLSINAFDNVGILTARNINQVLGNAEFTRITEQRCTLEAAEQVAKVQAANPTPPQPVRSDQVASRSPAASDDATLLRLSQWRLRDGIIRKAIAKEHNEAGVVGGFVEIGEFKIISAAPDPNDSKRIALTTEYTIRQDPNYAYGLPKKPVSYRRTVIVNEATEAVVDVGQAKQIANLSSGSSNSLTYWRLRNDVVRKAIADKHPKILASGPSGGAGAGDGTWELGTLRIVSVTQDQSDSDRVTLATEYTLRQIPTLSVGFPETPINYRQTVVVNNDTETVVDAGTPVQIN